MKQLTRERVVDGVERLSTASLDVESLVHEAGGLIRRAIPYDGACWGTMDPATPIETSLYAYRMPTDGRACAEGEHRNDDYNKFVRLARAPRHSGVLSEATGGVLERSRRYREVMRAAALGDELRASLVVDGLCWGAFVLFRQAPCAFTAAERDLAHDLTGALGRAFRGTLVTQPAVGDVVVDPPGVILFDGRGRVESMTAGARRWLADLPHDDGVSGGLPQAVVSVAVEARVKEADVMARVPGRSGRWVVVNASPATGGDAGRVAVVVQGAAPASVAPLIAAAYRFTDRERELAELVLDGYGTAEIAARLYISPLTVQVHLTSIFAKTRVRSRRELIGKIFARHYRNGLTGPADGGR